MHANAFNILLDIIHVLESNIVEHCKIYELSMMYEPDPQRVSIFVMDGYKLQ